MCRTGGRRCPSHSDPLQVAQYNAVRRARYASQNQKSVEPLKTSYTFPSITEDFPYMDGQSKTPTEEKYRAEVKEFSDLVDPDVIENNAYGRDLTDEEEDERDNRHKEYFALRDYTESTYTEYRTYLNTGKLDEEGEKSEYALKLGIENLDRAINKAPIPAEPRVLYRGLAAPFDITAENYSTWLAESFPVGGVISQPNYMSTTLSAGIADDFGRFNQSGEIPGDGIIFQILSKKGAVLGRGTSYRGELEMEVLLPRNARLKVVEVIEDAPMHFVWEKDNRVRKSQKTIIRLVDADEEEEN